MKQAPLAVVIPAYNEAETIAAVVVGARQFGDVIVVDDGSRDGTADLARGAGAIVVSLGGNTGYEGALGAGVQHAIDERYEFALTMDADGQHSVESARALISSLGAADVAKINAGFRREEDSRIVGPALDAYAHEVSRL